MVLQIVNRLRSVFWQEWLARPPERSCVVYQRLDVYTEPICAQENFSSEYGALTRGAALEDAVALGALDLRVLHSSGKLFEEYMRFDDEDCLAEVMHSELLTTCFVDVELCRKLVCWSDSDVLESGCGGIEHIIADLVEELRWKTLDAACEFVRHDDLCCFDGC